MKDAQSLNPLSIREGGFKTHNKGTFKTKQGFKKQGFKKQNSKFFNPRLARLSAGKKNKD